MKIGNKLFNVEEDVYIMGILNVTPDSFFDGGRYNNNDAVLLQTEKMINEGVDIIDIGGESTRPGHIKISDAEEIERLLPVISSIKKNFDIPISIDTYKPTVAKAVLNEGIDMINDIWGFRKDEEMARLVAEHEVACCLMHNRDSNAYNDFLNDVIEDLNDSINIAHKYKISDDKIIIDPGIGFAKTVKQNLLITKYINQLKYLGYPILYAASNKSFIGHTLDTDVIQRLEGTLACTAWAVAKGCSFVRVHQVMENRRVIQMIKAIMGGV